MKILTFNLNYADKRWDDYLKSMLGDEIAEKCLVESGSTKDMQFACVNILNFDGNAKVVQAIKSDNNVKSAYIIENQEIKKILV